MLDYKIKESQNFRRTLEAYKGGFYALSDVLLQNSETKKNLEKVLITDTKAFNKIALGEKTNCTMTLVELDSEIKSLRSRIKALNDEYNAVADSQKEALANGEALITEDVVKAVQNYLANLYDETFEAPLTEALLSMYRSFGYKDVEVKDIKFLTKVCGVKKTSARELYKTDKSVKAPAPKEIRTMLLRAMCDEPTLASMMAPHKWVAKITK